MLLLFNECHNTENHIRISYAQNRGKSIHHLSPVYFVAFRIKTQLMEIMHW